MENTKNTLKKCSLKIPKENDLSIMQITHAKKKTLKKPVSMLYEP